MPPDPVYWTLDTQQNLKDILSTYNKNIEINDAVLAEAARQLPLAGYDNSKLYIVPKYGPESAKAGQPAPPYNIVVGTGSPVVTGTIVLMKSPRYKSASPAIRLPKGTDIEAFLQMTLQSITLDPVMIGSGSGPVTGDTALTVRAMGPVTGPYGTADNTYATADQNPEATGFIGDISIDMDYRADCDPAYQFIARSSPLSFDYTAGYLTGSTNTPNGLPTGVGITFPHAPQIGEYFLRTDYLPQMLFRWSGQLWVRISTNVRTDTGFTEADTSLLSGYINNSNETELTNGTFVPQKQALSTMLKLAPDPLPPIP